jgi:hypothetical protein
MDYLSFSKGTFDKYRYCSKVVGRWDI